MCTTRKNIKFGRLWDGVVWWDLAEAARLEQNLSNSSLRLEEIWPILTQSHTPATKFSTCRSTRPPSPPRSPWAGSTRRSHRLKVVVLLAVILSSIPVATRSPLAIPPTCAVLQAVLTVGQSHSRRRSRAAVDANVAEHGALAGVTIRLQAARHCARLVGVGDCGLHKAPRPCLVEGVGDAARVAGTRHAAVLYL